MQIIKAEPKNGLIYVEHKILDVVRTLAFPLESTKEEIEKSLLEIEAKKKRRIEREEENKERLEAEAKAQKVCKNLMK